MTESVETLEEIMNRMSDRTLRNATLIQQATVLSEAQRPNLTGEQRLTVLQTYFLMDEELEKRKAKFDSVKSLVERDS